VGYHLAVCSGATTGGEDVRVAPVQCETITPRRSRGRSERDPARGRGPARTPDRPQEE
jgi:hypothetical protein